MTTLMEIGLTVIIAFVALLLPFLTLSVFGKLMQLEQRVILIANRLAALVEILKEQARRQALRSSGGLPEAKAAGDVLDEWPGWDVLRDPDGWKGRR